MGRKKITMDKISDLKNRRLSFKKRRMSLLKKALQLAKLSGCSVYLKIYNQSDKSLLELDTGMLEEDIKENSIKNVSCTDKFIKEFVSVNLDNYDLIE